MSAKDPQQVRRMFGRIVPRYDLMNRLMSLGMDRRWRRAAAAAARPSGGLALDVGTGTGDLAQELRRRGAARVVGVDFSSEMLRAARAKLVPGATAAPAWAMADALRLPFPNETFDCLTNAFLLRNLANLPAGLAEMSRVLKPEGRLVCLDMTRTPPGLFGALYRLYFGRLVPPLGALISGDAAAYRYLPSSVEGFIDGPTLAGLLADAGLTEVGYRLFGGGTVALHTARKPAHGG
jgi:demethylmenaquinone methyltransferase/2-methoxy-6-polyprenyl-1,4-benzoquinol methylase